MGRKLGGVLVVVALLLVLLPTAPAAATSTYLCTGYVGCKDDGYPHFGYKQASDRMWWRMYAGHNCTNYVAYRLVKGGMSPERPWDGTGMAYNWGRAKRGITDDKPMVGAVAWWERNVPGAGSSGHVAYVEKVLSRTKIVISEDSWSGDFHWRRIRKRGGGWPTGFIHFDDREVRAKQRPAVAGEPAVGRTLTAKLGTWSPSADLSLQWLVGGKPVPGATERQLVLTPEHRRKRLAVRVTATSRGYVPGTSTSVATARVQRGTMDVVSRPTVAGRARVGEVLELQPGAWSPAPQEVRVRWFADGEPIAGATGQRLRVVPDLVGDRITVRTRALREGYRPSPVTSSPTAAVERGTIAVTAPFELSGPLEMGRRLSVAPGTFTPADADVTYTWLRNGEPVKDATGGRYTLGVDDVGDQMAVRVRLTRTGYRAHTLVLEADGPVTTAPSLKLGAVGKPRRVVATLHVTAPGVSSPGGRATVRVGDRSVTGRVVDGRLRVVLRDITPGLRTVRVAYAGTDVIRAGKTSMTVRVPRR